MRVITFGSVFVFKRNVIFRASSSTDILRAKNSRNTCLILQQTGRQPGMVANHARGQLNRVQRIFPVPVRAQEFGLSS